MEITLKQCSFGDELSNWWTIIRKEYSGEPYWEEFEYASMLCRRYMSPERLSPEACIEGDMGDMLGIARAIKDGSRFEAKRCAVAKVNAGFYFWSPKNSKKKVLICKENAEAFAEDVFNMFKEKT